MDNKSRFTNFVKAAILIVWGSLTIGTTFAVWNASAGEVPNKFICTVAGLSLIVNGIAIWYVGKKLFENEE